jgi:hypothetical protein
MMMMMMMMMTMMMMMMPCQSYSSEPPAVDRGPELYLQFSRARIGTCSVFYTMNWNAFGRDGGFETILAMMAQVSRLVLYAAPSHLAVGRVWLPKLLYAAPSHGTIDHMPAP